MNRETSKFVAPHPNQCKKRLTWLFILLHLWSSIYPVHFVYAATPLRFSVAKQKIFPTQSYTLQFGEDALTVATKFNMNLAALKSLNRYRIFKHGFELIGEGDKIEVPTTPLKRYELYEGHLADTQLDNSGAATLATLSAQAGQFLTDNPNKDKTDQLARTLASGYVGSVAQRTLAQFGNARIKLDVDKHFSLKNSQAEVLFPFLEQGKLLAFFQGVLHRTESRNQSNLGTGLRYFGTDYMLGGNTFFDYDLSRHHSRLGLGWNTGAITLN